MALCIVLLCYQNTHHYSSSDLFLHKSIYAQAQRYQKFCLLSQGLFFHLVFVVVIDPIKAFDNTTHCFTVSYIWQVNCCYLITCSGATRSHDMSNFSPQMWWWQYSSRILQEFHRDARWRQYYCINSCPDSSPMQLCYLLWLMIDSECMWEIWASERNLNHEKKSKYLVMTRNIISVSDGNWTYIQPPGIVTCCYCITYHPNLPSQNAENDLITGQLWQMWCVSTGK